MAQGLCTTVCPAHSTKVWRKNLGACQRQWIHTCRPLFSRTGAIHQEFLRFLRQLDAEHAAALDLHLVLDNYGTHKSPPVQRWLTRPPRFKVHFIPTSSSWLNLVERWFGDLTGKAVRRSSFVSVPDLIGAIEEFIAAWNRDPKPFIWQAKAEDILAKIERCRQRLEQIQPGWTLPKRRKKAV